MATIRHHDNGTITVSITFDLEGSLIKMENTICPLGDLALTLLAATAKFVQQHTIYLGEAPGYGKACFKERYAREIARIKARYSDALYLTKHFNYFFLLRSINGSSLFKPFFHP